MVFDKKTLDEIRNGTLTEIMVDYNPHPGELMRFVLDTDELVYVLAYARICDRLPCIRNPLQTYVTFECIPESDEIYKKDMQYELDRRRPWIK